MTAPEQGEDFQVIADDYQKFIVPGNIHMIHHLDHRYLTSKSSSRFNSLATPILLWLFPNRLYLRRYHRRFIRYECLQPRLQREALLLCHHKQYLTMGQWTSSPACTELEALVMDWAAQLLGLSKDFMNASGIGGGSIQVCFF